MVRLFYVVTFSFWVCAARHAGLPPEPVRFSIWPSLVHKSKVTITIFLLYRYPFVTIISGPSFNRSTIIERLGAAFFPWFLIYTLALKIILISKIQNHNSQSQTPSKKVTSIHIKWDPLAEKGRAGQERAGFSPLSTEMKISWVSEEVACWNKVIEEMTQKKWVPLTPGELLLKYCWWVFLKFKFLTTTHKKGQLSSVNLWEIMLKCTT